MSGRSDIIDLELTLRFERDASYAVENEEGETVFLPKSLVEYDGHGTFSMPRWLAEDKGLC